MRDEYLNQIVRRGNELAVLEHAALSYPKNTSVIRWAVAAAFGMLVTFLPSVCTAHAFFQMM